MLKTINNRKAVYFLIFLFHPLLLLLLYPSLAFNSPGPDELMTLGAALNFDQLINLVQHDRHLDRLPALLMTYSAYKIFTPMVAHYVLFFFCFYLNVFLVFLIMKKIVSEDAAALAALLFGSNYWFLSIAGDQWFTRQITIFLFSAFFFVLRCAESENKIFDAMLSGFFTACAFFTHFATIPFLYQAPLYFLISAILKKKNAGVRILNFSHYFIDGFVACFLFFGLINKFIFRGDFLFFLNQLAISGSDYSGREISFMAICESVSNAMIAIAFMVSFLVLIKKRQTEKKVSVVAIWFVLSVTVYALFCALNTFFPHSPLFPRVLVRSYYRFWVIPVCAVTILACLTPEKIEWNIKKILMFYGGLTLSFSPLVIFIFSSLQLHKLINANLFNISFLALCAAVIAIFFSFRRAGFIALGIGLFCNTLLMAQYPFKIGQGFVDKAYFSRLYEGNKFIRELNLKAPIYFWIGNNKKEYGNWCEFRSFCKLWLFENNFIDGFPVFGKNSDSDFERDAFKVQKQLIIVDERSSDEAIVAGSRSLSPYAKKLIKNHEQVLGDENYRYTMTLCRIEAGLTWESMDSSWFSKKTNVSLIPNGSFEHELAGWNGPGDCTVTWLGEAKFKTEFSADSFFGIRGKKSLYLESSNHILCLNTHVQNLDVGKLYTLRIRFKSMKSDFLGRHPKLITHDTLVSSDLYYFFDKFGEIPPFSLPPMENAAQQPPQPKEGWVELKTSFKARASEATIAIYCPSKGDFKNSCYFDSVQITPVVRPH